MINETKGAEERGAKFARRVFRIAGIYGLLVVTPLYFSEARLGHDFPPAITHPEFYYGFTGVTVAWQVLFLILARDPLRYRMMMVPAMIEKASYAIAVIALFLQQRVGALIPSVAVVDLVLGLLFAAAFFKTRTGPAI